MQRHIAELWTSTPAIIERGMDWVRHTSCFTCHTTPCFTSDGALSGLERFLLWEVIILCIRS